MLIRYAFLSAICIGLTTAINGYGPVCEGMGFEGKDTCVANCPTSDQCVSIKMCNDVCKCNDAGQYWCKDFGTCSGATVYERCMSRGKCSCVKSDL